MKAGESKDAAQRLIIALSSLRCVSVCCTGSGRHVLAVTDARKYAHTCVNTKPCGFHRLDV